jgi:hypothetical protein
MDWQCSWGNIPYRLAVTVVERKANQGVPSLNSWQASQPRATKASLTVLATRLLCPRGQDDGFRGRRTRKTARKAMEITTPSVRPDADLCVQLL